MKHLHYLGSCSVLRVVPDPELLDQLHDVRLLGADPVSAQVQGIVFVFRSLDLDGQGSTPDPVVSL